MRILLDESLPRRLKKDFKGHQVKTVPEAGWQGKKNGELIKLMNGKYDIFMVRRAALAHHWFGASNHPERPSPSTRPLALLRANGEQSRTRAKARESKGYHGSK